MLRKLGTHTWVPKKPNGSFWLLSPDAFYMPEYRNGCRDTQDKPVWDKVNNFGWPNKSYISTRYLFNESQLGLGCCSVKK